MGGVGRSGELSAADVRRLTCAQSQEFAQSLWSVRLRTVGGSEAEFRAVYGAGEFVRTHVLRPTWHSGDPADLRWVLELTGSRVVAMLTTMFRRLGVGAEEVDRAELGRGMSEQGIDVSNGIVLGNLIMQAELELRVCGAVWSGTARSACAT